MLFEGPVNTKRPGTRHVDMAHSSTLLFRVWSDDVEGYDHGSEAASWLQKFIGVPCSLVSSAPQLQKRNLLEIPHGDKWYKMAKPEDSVRTRHASAVLEFVALSGCFVPLARMTVLCNALLGSHLCIVWLIAHAVEQLRH